MGRTAKERRSKYGPRGGRRLKEKKRDYRGDIKDFREYFMGLKVFRWTQEELMWVRNGQGGFSLSLK